MSENNSDSPSDDDFYTYYRDKYYRVLKLRPLFPLPLSTLPPTGLVNPAVLNQLARPVLELKLEEGHIFRMGGIPTSIAMEIWEVLERKKASDSSNIEVDPRYTLSQVINEIAEVKRVKIVDLLEKYNVYVAEVDMIPEGFGKPVALKMIPSHAILIGVRANAEMYVNKDLVEESESTLREAEASDEGFYDL
ncbi:MAG: hypothetical protein ACP6IP_00040 [Candidatus Njordarchaeia archaeon]